MYSASDIKFGRRRAPGRAPAPGSAIRRVYDLFMENKGRIVPWEMVENTGVSAKRFHQSMKRHLIDFYDLDFRSVCGVGMILVGHVCDDGKYEDYVAGK